MDMEATNEICDNRPILPQSAVSQRSIEIQIQPKSPTKETIVQIPLKPIKSDTVVSVTDEKKRNLKLDLKSPSIEESSAGGDTTTTTKSSRRHDSSTSDNEDGSAKQRHDSASSSVGSVEDENAKNNNEIRSPMSPRSPGNQGE